MTIPSEEQLASLLRRASLHTDPLSVYCDFCHSYSTHACVAGWDGHQAASTHVIRRETALRAQYAKELHEFLTRTGVESNGALVLLQDLLVGSEERIDKLEDRKAKERAKRRLSDEIMRESCRQQGLLDAIQVIERGDTRGIR